MIFLIIAPKATQLWRHDDTNDQLVNKNGKHKLSVDSSWVVPLNLNPPLSSGTIKISQGRVFGLMNDDVTTNPKVDEEDLIVSDPGQTWTVTEVEKTGTSTFYTFTIDNYFLTAPTMYVIENISGEFKIITMQKGNKSMIVYNVFFLHIDQKVLECNKNNKTVTPKVRDPNKAEQLWVKGIPNQEEYFTLESSEECSYVPKFMTAISASSFEIKGNYLLNLGCPRFGLITINTMKMYINE